MAINSDKILKELSKGTTEEQVAAYHLVKDAVTQSLADAQKKAEETASQLQSTIDRINGQ